MLGLGLGNIIQPGANLNNFSPVQNYNQQLSMVGLDPSAVNNFNETGELGNVKVIDGLVQVNVPKNLGAIEDQELVSDLKNLLNETKTTQGMQPSESVDELYHSFSDVLNKGINGLNETQKTAEKNIQTFAAGGEIDVHTVMISAEKANLSMQLALQLRNKIVTAYKEVSKIQV